MTRQVHELAETTDGIKAHITSLKPINPTNAPDTWERNALERFELGETEVSSLEEMDGYEATRALRESGYRGAIVALTAHAMNEEFVRCIQAGCDECAAKPIERAAFLAMLARHLTVRELSAIDATQDAF